MKHLSLQMYAKSPLAIRSDHAEGGAKTSQYIPGATLLGSLAAAHRLLRPKQEDEFAAFFLNEQVHYPHLYPASFDKNKVGINDPELPVMPLPKTAQSCKRFSGFKPVPGEESDDQRHGIRVSLLDWTLFSLLDAQYKEAQFIPTVLAPLNSHADCTDSNCHQTMDHIGGYYRCTPSDAKQRMLAKVSTRLQTRTGINRDWGIVEEGILYNREVFEEGMRFWGDILLPDELAEQFEAFLEEANEEDVVRIGTGRTRGLGRIDMKSSHATHEGVSDFTERVFNFHATLANMAKQVKVEQNTDFYFAITLYTPAILCDPFLRYQSSIDGATLSKLVGHSPLFFEQKYQATGTQLVTGWNELWGTPRTNDYAMETGSTFVFTSSQPPDNTLLQTLYALEEHGIGRRRTEGFGRIRISDPFHLEGEQV